MELKQSTLSDTLDSLNVQKLLNLTTKERQAIRDKVSNDTEQYTIDLLEKTGRALVVRPTGFGKTYLLCKLTERYYLDKYPDKKFVYIFPSYIIVNDIKSASGRGQTYEKIYPHLDFISYQEINLAFGGTGTDAKRKSIIDRVKDSPIILIDEVHKSASPNFMKFFEEIDDFIGADKCHLLGVTATIRRENLEETDWIVEEEFKGSRIPNYSINQAIADGVLLPPYKSRPVFDDTEIRELADSKMKKSKINSSYRKVQMQYLEDALKKWRNGSRSIYNAFEHVGYKLDSDNPDDSFMRLIVFFRDTKHLEEEGELVEDIFRKAVNEEASLALGKEIKTNVNIEYVISDTADKNNENIIRDLCKKHKDRVYRTDAEKVCTEEVIVTDDNGKKHKEYLQKEPKAHQLDLIFNVNVITMGYHVPYIAGVMFLRDTNTYICNRQQLGRCMSVTNTRQPIIFDVADNLSKDFSKEKRSNKNSETLPNEGTLIENIKDNDKQQRKQELEAKYKDDDDGTVLSIVDAEDDVSLVLDRLKDETLIKETCIYLYCERKMPIAYIANELELPIHNVLECLNNAQVKILPEQGTFNYVKDTKKDLIPYINCKEADEIGKKSGIMTLFSYIKNLLRGN